jgi:predicted PurR-regulated permease PerM
MFKIRWNKENTTAAIYACAVLALTLTGICIIVNIDAIYYAVRSFFHTISPLIYGLALAYLINSLLKFCERRLVSRLKTKKMVPMLRRMLSLVITYAFLALFIFLIGLLVIPQIVRNYEVIVTNTSAFISRMIERVASILGMGSDQGVADLNAKISEFAKSFLTYLGEAGGRFAFWFLQFLLGLFLSFFILLHKEKLISVTKKLLASMLRPGAFNAVMNVTHLTDRTFGRFFVGKIFDSLIIGVLSFVVFWVIRMPYYPLLSVIVCVTNVIPFFGPIIGAIPCVILVMTESPIMALWCAIIILIIQQLDGNVIGPKILGSATGLSSLWVVVSITVMGSFFGFIGMVIGVPLFSVLYTIVKERTEKRLKKKELPTETSAYADVNPLALLEEAAKKNADPITETVEAYVAELDDLPLPAMPEEAEMSPSFDESEAEAASDAADPAPIIPEDDASEPETAETE